MNIKLEVGFFIFIGVAILVGVIWMIITEKRLKRFFLGKKAKDLEDTIFILEQEISKLSKSKESIEKEISVIRGEKTAEFFWN